MVNSELNASLNLREVIESFSPYEDVEHALLLTYNFEGPYIEDQERGLMQLIWQRNCPNPLVIRDSKAILAEKHKKCEKHSLSYSVVNATYSRRTFHPKLLLLLSKSEASAVIGSANLTRGGLAKNLEFSCEYRLTHDEGPHHIFRSLHNYLDKHLRQELEKASISERDGFDNLVNDLGRLLEDTKSVKDSSERVLSFFHNYDKSLFDKILEVLPSNKLDAIWIVSPFYESEVTSDNPSNDKLDDTLFSRIFKTFKFTGEQQPPVRIYFQASSANATTLPLRLLKRLKSDIALYKKNPNALDQRTLHAKMFVFIGRKPSGERFVTIVHGSANFTSAALLSKPPAGNAEIVMATQVLDADVVAKNLTAYLNLDQLFNRIDNWDSLIEVIPSPVVIPVIQVWEGMISLEKMTIQIYFKVNSPKVQHIKIFLCSEQEETLLGEVEFPPDSKDFIELKLPYGTIKVINLVANLRQLPFNHIRLEAFDGNFNLLGIGEGALNVDNPQSTHINYIIDELELDSEIYNAGGAIFGTSIYLRKKIIVERILSGEPVDERIRPTHQGDLDLFFRRIHTGLRGLRWQIVQSKGSLNELGRIQRKLAAWGTRAAQEDKKLTREMRLYLCDRIVLTALEITEIILHARNKDKTPVSILRDDFFKRAGPIHDFVESLQNDEELGLIAVNVLKHWDVLKTEAGSAQ